MPPGPGAARSRPRVAGHRGRQAPAKRLERREVGLGAVFGLTTGILSTVTSSALLLLITPAIQDRLQQPTCDDPAGLDLVTPSRVQATVAELPPQGEHEFVPGNLTDGDSGTAWVEGVEREDNPYAVDAVLTFDFPEDVDLQLVCVVNGYAESWDIYRQNARIRLVDVVTDQGDAEEVGLPEKTEDSFTTHQSLTFETGMTDQIAVRIVAPRAGQGLDRATDLAISEVEFWRDEG